MPEAGKHTSHSGCPKQGSPPHTASAGAAALPPPPGPRWPCRCAGAGPSAGQQPGGAQHCAAGWAHTARHAGPSQCLLAGCTQLAAPEGPAQHDDFDYNKTVDNINHNNNNNNNNNDDDDDDDSDSDNDNDSNYSAVLAKRHQVHAIQVNSLMLTLQKTGDEGLIVAGPDDKPDAYQVAQVALVDAVILLCWVCL